MEAHIANNSKANPKEFYGYIRKKKLLAPSIGPIANENGEVTSDEVEMASILNKYFASVFTVESTDIIPQAQRLEIEEAIFFAKYSF